jgi:phage repressor protein C with HTH and peptisase S24 domain
MAKGSDIAIVPARVIEAREAKGLSQGDLAERTGMSQQGIASIESGESKRPRKMLELARALGRSEAWLFGQDEQSSAGLVDIAPKPNASFPPRYEKFPDTAIKILGQTVGGANGRFILNGQEIGRVFAPPDLVGVEGAYAVQVYGTSMEPKFEAGETVWLHPTKPVRAGDYVVAQIYGDDDDVVYSYIKRFVSRSAKVLRLYQLNPDEGEPHELAFDADRVFSVHKIVFQALV